MKPRYGDKSGYPASHSKGAAFIEHIFAAGELWVGGGVVIIGNPGPGEPGWPTAAPNLAHCDRMSELKALVAAARASVFIVGRDALFPPVGWELAAVAGCFVWSGQ